MHQHCALSNNVCVVKISTTAAVTSQSVVEGSFECGPLIMLTETNQHHYCFETRDPMPGVVVVVQVHMRACPYYPTCHGVHRTLTLCINHFREDNRVNPNNQPLTKKSVKKSKVKVK